MTMHDERLRALGYGRTSLQKIAAASVSSGFRKRAAGLLERYPSQEAIDRADGIRYRGMRFQDVEVMEGTLELMQDLRMSDGLDPDLRNDLWGTLRHFPTSSDIGTLRTIRERSMDSQGRCNAKGLIQILTICALSEWAVPANERDLSAIENLQRRLDEDRDNTAELAKALQRCVEEISGRLR